MPESDSPDEVDRQGFLKAVEDVKSPILRWLRRDFPRLHSTQFEDVWQNVLLAAWKDRDHYWGSDGLAGRSPLPWLRIVAKHYLIDELRRNRRRARAEQVYDNRRPIAEAHKTYASPMGIDGAFDFRMTDLPPWLRTAFDSLDKCQLELLRLRFWEGLGSREIAEQLQCNQNTITSKLRRLVGDLKERCPQHIEASVARFPWGLARQSQESEPPPPPRTRNRGWNKLTPINEDPTLKETDNGGNSCRRPAPKPIFEKIQKFMHKSCRGKRYSLQQWLDLDSR